MSKGYATADTADTERKEKKGEWKVRQQGVGKRRTWRKLLFCVDEATLEIVSVVASTNDVSTPSPRRELAAGPKSRAQTVEARERLPSPEFGGDSGLPPPVCSLLQARRSHNGNRRADRRAKS
jgi:hypothetical protein